MLNHNIPELDKKGLRQFGLILSIILIVFFGLFLPWVWGWKILPNFYCIGIGTAVAFWAFFAPGSLVRLYNVWMAVAMSIGYVINSVVLATIFYIVITPMAIGLRILGKDLMHLRLDESVVSYRVITKVRLRNHVERPY